MNTAKKILTIALIVIIIVSIGTTAYFYEQNTKTNNQPQPTPTPSPSPTINVTVTTSNQTYDVGLSGNITATQISNITITPIQSGSTTIVAFNVTGQNGSGFSNMTIPKTAITYGSAPVVYIDNLQAQNQGYAQDTNNFYVWYTTHFSTHEVQILFTTPQSPTPSPSPQATARPTPYPSFTLTSKPTPTPSPTTLTVSTTTSLHDTGLEDNGTGNIKDAFQAKYPWITVNFLAQGTGAAIQTAQRGDADMILAHSPSQEATFLSGGYGVDRKIIAYNFFIIVGPANDPAGISGMTNVSQALINLYKAAQTNSQVQWFTRNDGSGTATAEVNLWKAAGYTYSTLVQNTTWFHSTGSGMGQTLLIADNGIGGGAQGYCLSDTGTYLAYSSPSSIQPITLKIEIQAQQALLNVYSAIIDNPQNVNLTSINFNAAMLFVNYLVSDEGQQLIANYGVSTYGQQLFAPFVPLVSGTAPNATLLSWVQSYAYMSYNTATNAPIINASGTECPTQYRYSPGNLYSPTYDTVANINLNTSIILPNYYATDKQQLMFAPPSPSLSGTKINKQ
jgi:tungstate transport system substrate-binding protein